MRIEGRVRRLRGSPVGETAETHTAHRHPMVGTPIEVPVPRKVRVASMRWRCVVCEAERVTELVYRTMLGPKPGRGAPGPPGGGFLAAEERARAWVISRKP